MLNAEDSELKLGLAVSAGMAVLSLCAAAFLAFYPPPATFAKLLPADNTRIREGGFAVPVCGGVQCKLCPFECFLPEGARGRCKVRVNYGGKIKNLGYSTSVSVEPFTGEKPAAR